MSHRAGPEENTIRYKMKSVHEEGKTYTGEKSFIITTTESDFLSGFSLGDTI
jgi:hypothetical protein